MLADNVAYRIRKWGRLPRKRGATLVIVNHQHDLDVEAVMMWLWFEGPWRDPIFSAGGRRMFEPGFLVKDLPWLAPFLRRFDPTGLFRSLGLNPIENELGSRPLSSFAWSVRQRHGNLPLADVFEPAALARAGLERERLADLLSKRLFAAGKTYASLMELREPYREEVRAETRARVDADVPRLEHLVRNGATFFLTPEGRYSTNGRMSRFRAAYDRLSALADVYVVAVSYDVFRGRRPSVLYRVLGPVPAEQARDRLAAARPVTASQLVAEFVAEKIGAFDEAEAIAAIEERLRALPVPLFVDPELRARPERVVRESLAKMARLGFLTRTGTKYKLTQQRAHPSFERVADMLAYQNAFLAETLQAEARVRDWPPLPGGGVG
jgi:1-acyl-sn-glycerol-3-phosphate acyltransferase